MKSILIPVFLISVSVSCSQIGYRPIAGDLLNHWNTANSSCFSDVRDSDFIGLPSGFDELLMTGIEVEQDSLDIYLLGISPETAIPFLLATGGYRGEYNFERFFVYYHKEEDELELIFYMPDCSRKCVGYFELVTENCSLVQLRYYTEDSSLEALVRAESLLVEGNITEAIDELTSIQHSYTRYYYDPDEMIARLLRIINKAALEEVDENNYQGAVDLFEYLSDYNRMSFQWYMSFSDSLDFMESDRSNYMGLSEYVMILNNYAFFLEQTDDLYLSQKILRKVLDLQPSLMVAHLNIADVLWKLGEFAEAEEHYSIYLEIMTEGDLALQIPPYVQERINSLHATPAHSVTINILSEHSCPIEMMVRNPIRIDSCQLLESGGMRVWANRGFPVNDTFGSYDDEAWTIVIDPDGYPVSCEESASDNPIMLDSYRFGDYSEMLWLIARTEQGDTLWTCALEGTGESDYSPDATELPDGGYLLAIYPDCWTTYTWTARISSVGEMIWHNYLNTNYLLGLPGPGGEMKPHISSFRETSSGDILACGSVSEWCTSPDIWFVCLLDGDTGDPLWKTINFGLGEAWVYDAIETSSGMIVAVGSTATSLMAEDGSNRTVWGSKLPFIAILDSRGAFQKLVICDLDLTGRFFSIFETDPPGCEFLIVGDDSTSNEHILFRAIIPVDPE